MGDRTYHYVHERIERGVREPKSHVVYASPSNCPIPCSSDGVALPNSARREGDASRCDDSHTEPNSSLEILIAAEDSKIQTTKREFGERAEDLVADLIEVEPEHGLRKGLRDVGSMLAEAFCGGFDAEGGLYDESGEGEAGHGVVPAPLAFDGAPAYSGGEEER